MKEAELNLEELRKSCRAARKRFDAFPEWKKQAAREILDAASSEESRETLNEIRNAKYR